MPLLWVFWEALTLRGTLKLTNPFVLRNVHNRQIANGSDPFSMLPSLDAVSAFSFRWHDSNKQTFELTFDLFPTTNHHENNL